MPTLTLICATKNRSDLVTRRIPIWCACGVDAVIIVDATSDGSKAKAIELECLTSGATYIRFPPSARDTRSKQRNLGVNFATTDWILIQDDDDNIVAEFDHGAFNAAAQGVDYVWDGKGNHLVFHRRDNFLRLGGYPEDMVNAEDMVFSRFVRASSRGGLEGVVYRRIVEARGPVETRKASLSRVANLFWYAFTLMRFLVRSPRDQRTSIIISAMMTPMRVLRDKLPTSAAVIVIPISFLGFSTGFAWHYLRLTLDGRFRRSVALYRDMWDDGVDA